MADSGEESDRPRTGDIVERTARAVERGSAGLPVGVRGGRAPLARRTCQWSHTARSRLG
ncbi:MAG TPA: hypothetical protein VIC85_06890 [Ktedonobacterales bacterium]|jgi:hypothetical protein